jgi:hypothetical protein
MSRRTAQYRHLKRANVHETAIALMQRHSHATGRGKTRAEKLTILQQNKGAVCSLPMSAKKAQRLAAAIHKERA